jgi:hypothetical protein
LPALRVKDGGLGVGVAARRLGEVRRSFFDLAFLAARLPALDALRQVFTMILYSQVLKALSLLKPFMLAQTLIQTSWAASWASSLPSIRAALRFTRSEWVRTSLEKASTSPLEAREIKRRSRRSPAGLARRRSNALRAERPQIPGRPQEGP